MDYKDIFKMGLAITNKTIEKYFSFLKKLDYNSKKRLIVKLTESIEFKDNKTFDLKDLYGAWEDEKNSDEIIKEIRDSRSDKTNIIEF